MKTKKLMSILLALLLLCAPVVQVHASGNEFTEEQVVLNACYQKTVTRQYRNTTEMPNSITYQEGTFAGTLYLIRYRFENYRVHATYQGVLCDGPVANLIVIDQ